jgi:SAM-dependent methyltransferase
MEIFAPVIAALAGVVVVLRAANHIAYHHLKEKRLRRERWALNICCGKTDGGGINADIVQHSDLPNFVLIDDIYDLPFGDGAFENVFCSHAMEHVEDPDAFFGELNRVGKRVVILIPPLWDIGAALNIFEHKWIFLTFSTEHETLPPRVRLPFAETAHRVLGQAVKA